MNMKTTNALMIRFLMIFALILAAHEISFGQATGPVEFKLKQVHVNGLLVMPLASGKEAGTVSLMNATAVPGNGSIRFNQGVGQEMQTALNEVQKYMSVRHPALPLYSDLELAFEEKYSGKDGPSAAVACALLMEGAVMGKTWDSAFAVTGDMNADGTVQPIGGVAAKIRGASNGSCKLVAVPAKNESSVSDVLVMDGPLPLLKIGIFAIKHFNEAVALATEQRDEALAAAVAEFMIIQDVCLRDPRSATSIMKTPQAMTRLQAVLQKAPHCLSAKYLLLYAQGRVAKTLSLVGSVQAVDSGGQGLLQSVKNDEGRGGGLGIQEDEIRTTLNSLRNMRPKIDNRVWPYLDALIRLGDVVRAQVLNPARSGSGLEAFVRNASTIGATIKAAKSSLLSDPAVIEELGL